MNPPVHQRHRDRRAVGPLIGALLSAGLTCGTVSAQPTGGEVPVEVPGAPDATDDTPALDAREVAGPIPGDLYLATTRALETTNAAARRELNLKVAGWLVVASSLPSLIMVMTPVNCRRRVGPGSGIDPGTVVGLTVGIGGAIALAGTLLRARRMRGLSRTRIQGRQALFRAPWARGMGLTALTLGTFVGTFLGTIFPLANRCID